VATTRNQGELRHKYLQPADLRRLEYLLFAPRKVVEGRFSGQYATRQRGQSVEFRDYREYFPGDDLGHIDWKVYGRSDKLFIRLFEHQSELTVQLLVDASGSMAYRGLRPRKAATLQLSKYDHACHLAASIAFLTVKQHDRFSFMLGRQGNQHFLPPDGSVRHLSSMLQAMESIRPRGPARIPESIEELSRRGTRRSLLVIFSDLLDDPEAIAKALAARSEAGGEAIVFHILHPDEVNLPEIDHGLFIDAETGSRVRMNIDEVRSAYQDRFREFLNSWSQRCAAMGFDYMRALTSQPYYQNLEQYLIGRAARRA